MLTYNTKYQKFRNNSTQWRSNYQWFKSIKYFCLRAIGLNASHDWIFPAENSSISKTKRVSKNISRIINKHAQTFVPVHYLFRAAHTDSLSRATLYKRIARFSQQIMPADNFRTKWRLLFIHVYRQHLDKFVRSATDVLTCSSISSDWVSTICFLISSISSISRCRSRSSASTSISRSRRRLCNALPLQEKNTNINWCVSWVLHFLSLVNRFKIHAEWCDQKTLTGWLFRKFFHDLYYKFGVNN